MKGYNPFLKYVGGKRWFVSNHKDKLPKIVYNYYEPFLGGGAIYFYLMKNEIIKNNVHLNDLNSELINTYKQVKNSSNQLLEELKVLKNSKEQFEIIKKRKAQLNVGGATRYIYLNKTAYGGIYRVNKKGEFNVPYSNRKYKTFINEEDIRNCSNLLTHANLDNMSFDEIEFNHGENSLVCLDPPYIDLESKFNRYNIRKFNKNDLEILLNRVENINRNNTNFLLFLGSNRSIAEQFSNFGDIVRLNRSSNLSLSESKRKTEYIVKNY